MKTYTTTTEKPRLVISYDMYETSPRSDSNLGYFITVDQKYHSPDDHDTMESIVRETGQVATSLEEHIKMIKKEIEDQVQEKVIAIYPVVKYEHGGVVYRLGTQHGFDYSNNGFYIITDKTQKELGTPKKLFEQVIKGELETYTSWVNGEVYQFMLYDEQGNIIDSCGGIYDIEHIKEYLSDEWKDEKLQEYIK